MIHIGVSGQYKIRVLSAGGLLLRETSWFDNVITDVGLDRFAIASNAYMFLGTGQVEITTTSVNLTAPIMVSAQMANWASEGMQITSLPYYSWQRDIATFTVIPYSTIVYEVGIGTGLISGTPVLLSGTLIKDIGGTPIGLPVEPGNTVEVVYELRNYMPTDDNVYTETLAGESRTCTVRPLLGSQAEVAFNSIYIWPRLSPSVHDFEGYLNGDLNPMLGYNVPTGTMVTDSSYEYPEYVPGSYEMTFASTWNATKAAGPYSGFKYQSGLGMIGQWQIKVDPGIVKTSTQAMRVYFRVSWGRYEP